MIKKGGNGIVKYIEDGFCIMNHKKEYIEDIDKALKEMRPPSKDSVGIRINGNEF